MNNTFYLETDSTNPYFNLAFEEYILKNKLFGDYLILWQNDNTIVIGQNQNTLAEIDASFVNENNINVVRRSTGGGAVYHDLGNLNYSFITDTDRIEVIGYERFTKPIANALSSLGLDAAISGRNDITISGKKISGTAQRIHKNRILHHGTLLFDSDFSMISKSLSPDPDKFIGKASKSVRQRVGNIRDFLKKDMDLPEFWQYLKTFLLNEGYANATLSESDFDAINELKTTKYDTWEWNYGRSPLYETVNKKSFSGGIVSVGLKINKGIIEDIDFYGDFLSRRSLSTVKEALQGHKYKYEAIKSALDRISDFSDYFGDIDRDEILSLILS